VSSRSGDAVLFTNGELRLLTRLSLTHTWHSLHAGTLYLHSVTRRHYDGDPVQGGTGLLCHWLCPLPVTRSHIMTTSTLSLTVTRRNPSEFIIHSPVIERRSALSPTNLIAVLPIYWMLKACKAGYVFCFCFLFIYLLFFDDLIPVRPIISKSTGPIFARFSGLVELGLYMINPKLVFRSLEGCCHGDHFCRFYSQNWFAGCRRLGAQLGGLTLGFALHTVKSSMLSGSLS